MIAEFSPSSGREMDREMERCLDDAIEHVARAVTLAKARGWTETATECSRVLGRLNGVLYEVRSGEVIALEAERVKT
jgi:hypothetical protein